MSWAARRSRCAVLCLLALGAWARPAAACGSCSCAPDESSLAIIELIRDLPLNLSIPLRRLDDAEAPPRLERVADGMLVAATVDPVSSGIWWLSVDSDLEPKTEYRIVRDSGTIAQFATGTARDTSPPTLQGVSSVPGGNADLCERSVGGQVKLDGADDGSTFAAWVELEVEVNGIPITLLLDYAQSISLGHSAMSCFGTRWLPDLDDGSRYAARVRLHDAAGNASDWQVFSFDVVAEEPGGCGPSLPVAATSGASGTDGTGALPAGGTGSTKAGANADDELDRADSARTSKGCGCVLGQQRHESLTLAALLTWTAVAGFVCRRVRTPKHRNPGACGRRSTLP